MVLSLAEAQKGVPFTGTKPRYSLVSDRNSTWVFHRMAAAASLDGAAPRTASVTTANIAPVVTPGRAEFTSLTHGGLFRMVANSRLPMILEAIDNTAAATFSTVDSAGNVLRTTLDPAKVPYELAPGEIVKATGGTAASYVGILVRLIEAKIL